MDIKIPLYVYRTWGFPAYILLTAATPDAPHVFITCYQSFVSPCVKQCSFTTKSFIIVTVALHDHCLELIQHQTLIAIAILCSVGFLIFIMAMILIDLKLERIIFTGVWIVATFARSCYEVCLQICNTL